MSSGVGNGWPKYKKRWLKSKQFQKDLVQIDIQLKEVTAVTSESQEIPDLLKIHFLHRPTKRPGIFLLFKPEPELPRDFVTEVPFGVQVKGHYTRWVFFFDQIRRLPRLINVHNLKKWGPMTKKSEKITPAVNW